MSALRVCLFGQLKIQNGEKMVTDLPPPKLQEMFCRLLLFRDRPHPRETLASLLWTTSSTAQSKRNLRQALWQLQRSAALREPSQERELFLVDAHWIRLNPKADLWLDVEVLEQAFSRVEGVPGWALDAAQVQALREAVELYHGDLLEDCFQDWCLYERERLQNIYLCVLDKLMDYCETHDEYEAGSVYGARALQWDGARERTYRRLMRLQCLAGDRSAAMRQYDRCVKALRRELDVLPSERTVALYQQIRTGRLRAPRERPPSRNSEGGPAGSQWPELLEEFKQMQETLAQLQGQLDDAVRVAEKARTGQPRLLYPEKRQTPVEAP